MLQELETHGAELAALVDENMSYAISMLLDHTATLTNEVACTCM